MNVIGYLIGVGQGGQGGVAILAAAVVVVPDDAAQCRYETCRQNIIPACHLVCSDTSFMSRLSPATHKESTTARVLHSRSSRSCTQQFFEGEIVFSLGFLEQVHPF